MPDRWQEINAECHLCHWWRDRDGGRITAMTFLIALIAVAAVIAAAARLRSEIRSDGYGHHRPPRSHAYEQSPAPADRGLSYPY